jgi:hypothetical protein
MNLQEKDETRLHLMGAVIHMQHIPLLRAWIEYPGEVPKIT